MSIAESPEAQSGPSRVIWHTGFEVGHPLIDAQHIRLFEAINEVWSAAEMGNVDAAIERLDVLVRHAMQHFHDEEDLLRRLASPAVDSHREAHLRLVERMLTFRYGVLTGHATLAGLIDFLADELVVAHTLGADRVVFGLAAAAPRRDR